MAIDVSLSLTLDLRLYSLEEAAAVEKAAAAVGGAVYCWHSTGNSNWMTLGFSVADELGFVVLPPGLPDYIDMPDDAIERGAGR